MTTEELFDKHSVYYSFGEGDPEYLIDKEDFQKAVQEYTEYYAKNYLKIGAEELLDKLLQDSGATDYEDIIILAMQEYARIKCLEAIKKTKYIVNGMFNDAIPHGIQTWEARLLEDIMNIPNQEVMPKL